jgi:PIN domain nuclease of toxin-antitoxin system
MPTTISPTNSTNSRRTYVDILLDTHVAVWWADDSTLLASAATAAIEDESNTIWFSSASAWELSIKVRSGKLSTDVARLVDQLTRNGIRLLGVGVDDAITAGSLEWAHRDPFDRMLAAQAKRLGYQLATRDRAITSFMGQATLLA